MAPGAGNGNQQQQQNVNGKKANSKGTSAKRKMADESSQRRAGCPVLLESGCRVGEPVDQNNPADAVKVLCQNPKCEFSPFIHRRCYDEWEDLLVTVMATTSWSRSWTDAQRRSNLWDKKGYQLIGKMCRCLCGKGHVRRELDYKPPQSENITKKKVKKTQGGKSLPALKNPDFKSGFIGKQLPNANQTSNASTSSPTVPSNCFVTRISKRANFQQPSGSSEHCPSYKNVYQRASYGRYVSSTQSFATPEKTADSSMKNVDDGQAKSSRGSCSNSQCSQPLSKVPAGTDVQSNPDQFYSEGRKMDEDAGSELLGARSPSSGFDEESVGSLKSELNGRTNGNNEITNTHVPPPMIHGRESIDSGFWPSEYTTYAYTNRSFPYYGSAAGQYLSQLPVFYAGMVHPLLERQYTEQPIQSNWCFREYQLFNGPSLEDLFRQELPSVYSGAGRRFELTDVYCN